MPTEITDEMISTLETAIDKGWNWIESADLTKGVDVGKFDDAIRMCAVAEDLLMTARENQHEYERLDQEIKDALALDPQAEVWIPEAMKRHATATVLETSNQMRSTIFKIEKVLGV